MTSLPVPSLPDRWLPFMSHPLTMLLPVMCNCAFRTTTMVRKKARECPYGHVSNILPVMTSLPVTWRHFRSGPLPVRSIPVTHTQWHTPLCSPEIFLELSRYTTLIFGFGGTLQITHEKNIEGRHSSFPLGVSVKGIAKVFNWLKCLGGFLHLKPTVGCQISTLIFDFFLWRGGSL